METNPNYYEKKIFVDGSALGNPGPMEYRGVDENGIELFRYSPGEGTNNIAEFLAVVHALGYLAKIGDNVTPIFSDSNTAISWVKKKKCNTSYHPRKEIIALINRAETFLNNTEAQNAVIKWETKIFGENPADFGRK